MRGLAVDNVCGRRGDDGRARPLALGLRLVLSAKRPPCAVPEAHEEGGLLFRARSGGRRGPVRGATRDRNAVSSRAARAPHPCSTAEGTIPREAEPVALVGLRPYLFVSRRELGEEFPLGQSRGPGVACAPREGPSEEGLLVVS